MTTLLLPTSTACASSLRAVAELLSAERMALARGEIAE
jgi:hypothetical protein